MKPLIEIERNLIVRPDQIRKAFREGDYTVLLLEGELVDRRIVDRFGNLYEIVRKHSIKYPMEIP
ncbi:MAG TPA: hypothetical protein VK797_22910 [Tepidisphaeraceae bacterium]|jgi:hypothetical protein|nr:hypothetical protein [Tepidisphaeraceae bacterium]